jgi:Ser/Thr protein kinase RdoA (MazF antagonist)
MEIELPLIEQRWRLHNVRLKRTLTSFGSQGVYHLQAEEGDFVFKQVVATAGQALGRQLFLVEWLQAHDFSHVPKLLKCENDEAYSQFGDSLGYLYHFIPGVTPAATPAHYAQLGDLAASLHQIEGYPHPVAWSIRDIVGHIIHDRAPHVPAEFRQAYIELAHSLPAMDDLPRALIHGDLALVNTVKGVDDELTLIDWDGGGLGIRLFDVAYLLFQWLSDELTFDQTSAQAFFRAYLTKQLLSDREFAHLLDLSLLLPLNFILFGDPAKKWQRIRWLHEHRTEIIGCLAAVRT